MCKVALFSDTTAVFPDHCVPLNNKTERVGSRYRATPSVCTCVFVCVLTEETIQNDYHKASDVVMHEHINVQSTLHVLYLGCRKQECILLSNVYTVWYFRNKATCFPSRL